MIVQRAGHHFFAGLTDYCQLFVGHLFRLEGVVCLCSRHLENAECAGDFTGHGFDAYADPEVFVAAFRLRCPVLVGGYPYLAHGVVVDSVVHIRPAP